MKTIVLIVFFFSMATARADVTPPIVAVASNLRFVIEDIADSFEKETGLKVRFSFGSSGNIARQIIQGAPFQMFMSADEDYVFRVSASGFGVDRGEIYAYGRIAAFVAAGSPLRRASFPDGYREYFSNPASLHFAIANPELAPYGRAARQALVRAGLWKLMKPRLVYGENISQTAQFALSGSAAGGIIAYSLALLPQFRDRGEYRLIAADWHQPLAQRMVLLKRAGDTAAKFYEYVGGRRAGEIFRKSGYIAP